jgi:hypothetical protein
LESVHIIHCGDLVHVFAPRYAEDIISAIYPEEIISTSVLFPKLRTIHLHDLPKLQQISKVKMVAPALEKKPTVEIEKDVWDALEWDAGHRPDHFEAPVHSRYYKKKLPRVSFLRYDTTESIFALLVLHCSCSYSVSD